jgi:secreted trypsin-like serine protease
MCVRCIIIEKQNNVLTLIAKVFYKYYKGSLYMNEETIVYVYYILIMMIIVGVLYLLSLFDVATSVDYICDRRASCGCSKQVTAILTKIVGGEPVGIPHSWGWMASLRRDSMHSCGASLLTPWFVITAAHCLDDIESLSRITLNFGTIDYLTIGELRSITKMIIHPLYDQTLKTNDLAILRLNKPIDLIKSNISCICLPERSEFDLRSVAQYPPVGVNLIAIGWGMTSFAMRLPSPVLRQVTLQSMDPNEVACTNQINDDVLQFCAGYPEGGRDTCRGDSGGPLMLFTNGRWQLTGITSYGGICGSPETAGIYTRVAYYDSFIQEIIQSNETLVPNTKDTDGNIERSSNTNSIYQKASVELPFFLLFIVYNKICFLK